MNPAPIKLSKEADDYLRRTLADTRHDMDAALVWSPLTVAGGEDRPALILGWYKKGERPQDSFFTLCGYSVSIMPTTLEHIEGRTIDRRQFPTGFIDGPQHYYLLTVGDAASL